MPEPAPDAVVVGSGPNGLAAAIELARSGRSVSVLEGESTLGGGCRSAELTLPGFIHDTCSTVQSLALASPFLRRLPLAEHGLELAHPEVPLAHPLDDGSAVLLERSVERTAGSLGADGGAYRRLFGPLVGDADALLEELLGPLRVPRHPLVLSRFGPAAVRSAVGLG
nr:NAD(P)/FAD-dependent oxidoreductase [Thermoleophilaceae bacterium]